MEAAEDLFHQLTDKEKQAYKRLCVASSSKDRGRCQPSWKKLASVIAGRDDVPIAPELVSRIVDLSDEKAQSMQELFTHIKEYQALEAKAEPVVVPKALESFQDPRDLTQATSDFFRKARQKHDLELNGEVIDLIRSEKQDKEFPHCRAFLDSFTLSIMSKDGLPLPRKTEHVMPFHILLLLGENYGNNQAEVGAYEGSVIQQVLSYVKSQVKSLPSKESLKFAPNFFQKKAWNTGYVGKSDGLLRSAISSMYKHSLAEKVPWKNFCAIIQGSGTGKSRLVDKLAESVFTIPLVLRPDDDETGYPRGDIFGASNVLNLFCQGFSSVDQANRTYLLFMLNMVSYACDWIDNYLKEGHGTATIAADWREYLGPPGSPNRMRMFERANSGSIPKGFEEIWNIDEGMFPDVIKPLVENFLKAIAKKLNHDTEIHPLFVFYFDEAHHLTNYMVKSKRTAYQCLCNVMTYMLRAPVFGLFISTFSRLSQFSPRPRNFWSSRLLKPTDEGSDDDMHAPFVELPFDFWKQATIVVEGAHTGDEICSLPFMARFGRPLFWTLLEAKAGPAQVMELAMSKLRLRFENEGNYDSSDVNLDNIQFSQLIPLLAVRVDFTFASNRDEAVYLERLLVASSMRTVYSVPQHKEYLRGGYPSEPFLAEAAARMMFGSL
ncbi:hypothetical protein AGABI1DRAFT_128309 [Agaricus bisporus var. burnettii JB137-S8]|uniref:Uncharacterized protein n=1 Tax=Agaricus bisporus var. burnettii (strain JB137-S8 / ATCC MYA-4627 / FGSC 10392) TaxID=597362 RepID=K5WUN8_AGABU|nr:uncharacterized protein AGABI1DRAFT_128309 [Agaricus bisporus var. burnettii JB137-S8]EKM79146.1 hypothetical protein AGABI1DRAFT_128309 [Agaricus bisporus var. burnettii JB137-S8]